MNGQQDKGLTIRPIQDTSNQQYNNPPSYLERLYQKFPNDVIVGDGNFTFQDIHWRNLKDYDKILIPIKKNQEWNLVNVLHDSTIE